jgi:peptidoglycan/LPS O-acetylase OafA/YrhL
VLILGASHATADRNYCSILTANRESNPPFYAGTRHGTRNCGPWGVLLRGFYWQYSGLSFSPWAKRFMAATQPGWMGVNLFFVLSGFLITGILLDSKKLTKSRLVPSAPNNPKN